jgi:hypothetical protein
MAPQPNVGASRLHRSQALRRGALALFAYLALGGLLLHQRLKAIDSLGHDNGSDSPSVSSSSGNSWAAGMLSAWSDRMVSGHRRLQQQPQSDGPRYPGYGGATVPGPNNQEVRLPYAAAWCFRALSLCFAGKCSRCPLTLHPCVLAPHVTMSSQRVVWPGTLVAANTGLNGGGITSRTTRQASVVVDHWNSRPRCFAVYLDAPAWARHNISVNMVSVDLPLRLGRLVRRDRRDCRPSDPEKTCLEQCLRRTVVWRSGVVGGTYIPTDLRLAVGYQVRRAAGVWRLLTMSGHGGTTDGLIGGLHSPPTTTTHNTNSTHTRACKLNEGCDCCRFGTSCPPGVRGRVRYSCGPLFGA